PSFSKKFDLLSEDVDLIKSWIQRSRIYFGFDHEQRTCFLKKVSIDGQPIEENEDGTWKKALDRLIISLACNVDPLVDLEEERLVINMTKAEILGTLAYLLESLKLDLEPIIADWHMAPSFWFRYFECLLESYFIIDSKEDPLLKDLEELRLSLNHLNEVPLSFSSVRRVLQQLFDKRDAAIRTANLQAVRFSTLSLGQSIPAKIIYLLGMEEEAFPRKESKVQLVDFVKGSHPYLPSKIDEERYLFLEQILAARSFLIFSYQKTSLKDGKPQEPSLAIQELFSYLDSAFLIKDSPKTSEALTFDHPIFGFDRRYFMGAYPTECSQEDFKNAHIYYSQGKKSLKTFLEMPLEKSIVGKESEIKISLAKLQKLAKHPIKFFLEEVLGIYVQELGFSPSLNDEFSLSLFLKACFRNASLKHSADSILKRAQDFSLLPLGPFKEIAKRQIEQETTQMNKMFNLFSLSPSNLFTAEFQSLCKEPRFISQDHCILPAFAVHLQDGRVVEIVGTLSHLCSQGMVVHMEGGDKDLFSIWPSFLLFLNVPFLQERCAPKVLFTKSGKHLESPFEDPLLEFRTYVDYYFVCKKFLSPFMPAWAPFLLKEDREGLQKALENLSSWGFTDEVLQWFQLREPSLSASALVENWSPYLKSVFGRAVL
ncbi:MAG: hypothetical protein ACM3JI_04230, partial [Anaerolineae bacterium]